MINLASVSFSHIYITWKNEECYDLILTLVVCWSLQEGLCHKDDNNQFRIKWTHLAWYILCSILFYKNQTHYKNQTLDIHSPPQLLARIAATFSAISLRYWYSLLWPILCGWKATWLSGNAHLAFVTSASNCFKNQLWLTSWDNAPEAL